MDDCETCVNFKFNNHGKFKCSVSKCNYVSELNIETQEKSNSNRTLKSFNICEQSYLQSAT